MPERCSLRQKSPNRGPVPGIVGFITRKPRATVKAQLLPMVHSVGHESFYESGTYADESLGVYVGWTALKGSFSDGMLLRNEREDVSLVFSGEEYSDPRTVHELRSRGHCIGSSESGYLVHLYEEDPNFVQNLNGMFHGLIVDRTRGAVTLFNDRYGMHRLYYHESKDGFYFATEAKAILAVRPELRASDPRALGEFVACSCVLENRTIFKDIHVLPAASAWTFRNAELERKNTYFEPGQWEHQTPLAAESYYQELRSILSTNLPRYFASRQQMGIAMTGGLDTRVILSCHSPAPGSLQSYTFGSKFRDSQDVRIGRQIASICRQPHQVIEIGNEFLTGFPDYAKRSIYITEGTVDVYRASDLYVSEKVREIAPAKIVGTYGSEILRHAVMFKPAEPLAGLFCPDFVSNVRDAGTTYAALRQQHPVTFAAFRQSPWYHHGVLALEQSQLTVRSPFMDNDFVRTVYRAPKENSANGDVRLRLIRDGSPALGRIRSDRGVGGKRGCLTSFLSRAFQEFTFKAEYAYDYGMPQSVARIDHFLSGLHLERLFLGRHKLLHFRVWYRDQLSQYVRQMLLDPLTLSRPYLQKKTVETVVESHLNGAQNYTMAIHKLLTLELLQRLFLGVQ
jgi:asparagine synthase (glutamine-hydrolysing)